MRLGAAAVGLLLCLGWLFCDWALGQAPREAAQRAFDRGYQFQTGRGIRRDLRKAIEAYREAIRLDPSYADAFYNMAQIYLDFRLYNMAELGFKGYLRLKPDDAQVIHDLGVAYHKQGKYDLAIQQYRRALALDPSMAQAHFNLGNVYYLKKQEAMAIQEWDRAIEMDPENETYINRRERISQIRRQKESLLSPNVVWGIMYAMGGVFVIYYVIWLTKKRRR